MVEFGVQRPPARLLHLHPSTSTTSVHTRCAELQYETHLHEHRTLSMTHYQDTRVSPTSYLEHYGRWIAQDIESWVEVARLSSTAQRHYYIANDQKSN